MEEDRKPKPAAVIGGMYAKENNASSTRWADEQVSYITSVPWWRQERTVASSAVADVVVAASKAACVASVAEKGRQTKRYLAVATAQAVVLAGLKYRAPSLNALAAVPGAKFIVVDAVDLVEVALHADVAVRPRQRSAHAFLCFARARKWRGRLLQVRYRNWRDRYVNVQIREAHECLREER